jgi:hypothetical protein
MVNGKPVVSESNHGKWSEVDGASLRFFSFAGNGIFICGGFEVGFLDANGWGCAACGGLPKLELSWAMRAMSAFGGAGGEIEHGWGNDSPDLRPPTQAAKRPRTGIAFGENNLTL